MKKSVLRSYVVVTYSAMVSGYKPAILFTVHARDIDHARVKLAVLFRPLEAGETLISYQDYLADNALVREQIS